MPAAVDERGDGGEEADLVEHDGQAARPRAGTRAAPPAHRARRPGRSASTTPATSATTATSGRHHPRRQPTERHQRPDHAQHERRQLPGHERRTYRRLAAEASAATLSAHLAGVAQRLEPQPSKLVVRVRFPSPAPVKVQLFSYACARKRGGRRLVPLSCHYLTGGRHGEPGSRWRAGAHESTSADDERRPPDRAGLSDRYRRQPLSADVCRPANGATATR